MTTDNRTNEPTPEQIEAAAQAVREVDARAGLIADVDLPMYRARAALVAAAGAAPPAPSEYAYCPIHGDLLAANRSYRCGNAPTGHEYAAPVQPSSTVDADALIREAKAEAWGEGYDEWAQAPAGDQPPRDNPYREGSET